MKRQLWAAAACGAGLGLCVVVILAGMATPDDSGLLLSLGQAKDMEQMAAFSGRA